MYNNCRWAVLLNFPATLLVALVLVAPYLALANQVVVLQTSSNCHQKVFWSQTCGFCVFFVCASETFSSGGETWISVKMGL